MADAKKASNRLPSGVTQFDLQASAPSADSERSQLYAKEVTSGGGGGELLAHLNGIVDSSGNDNNGTEAACSGYSDSISGFGKKLRLVRANYSNFRFPDPGIATSDYTIEFFFNPLQGPGVTLVLLNDGQLTYGKWNVQINAGNEIAFWNYDGSTYLTYNSTISGGWYGLSGMQHLAIVREDAGSGTSNIRMYFNGNYLANSTSTSYPATTYSVGNSSQDWLFGHYPDRSNAADGYVDELRITKEALYFGTTTYDIPTAPHSDGTGEVLFHFDDPFVDSSGNGNNGTVEGVPLTGDEYINSIVTGTGFKKSYRIKNYSQALQNGNYVWFPDPGIGTSDLTIEFFFTKHDTATNQALISFGSLTLDENILLYTGAAASNHMLFYQGLGSGSSLDWNCDWADDSAMHHYALVRKVTDSGNAQWDLYFDGVKQAFHSGDGSPSGNLPIADISGGKLYLGRSYGVAPYNYAYALKEGEFDELRVTKSAIYDDDFDPPDAPFSAGGGAAATKLFVMDSAGNETQLG